MGSYFSSQPTPHKKTIDQLSDFIDVAFVDFAGSGGERVWKKANPNPTKVPHVVPQPDRLVCIGDLHGDLPKTKRVFKLAGLINDNEDWSGGDSVCVQVGDALDRGAEEIKVLYFLERLRAQAASSGGALYTINGNHETMNMHKDFRYVTLEGANEFTEWVEKYNLGEKIKRKCGNKNAKPLVFDKSVNPVLRARDAALRPGGPLSMRFFSWQNTVQIVGDSVFAHGGLLPKHVPNGTESVEKINTDVQKWMKGEPDAKMPKTIRGKESVVWSRHFASDSGCDCDLLQQTLTALSTKRMVVGHTIFSKINSECAGRIVRIDVGMSKGCEDGVPQALEIQNGKVTVLKESLIKDKYKQIIGRVLNPSIRS
eukprot:c16998_g1_i1.p1 GENE.c16998_g1_i1~~c16998_g1_i1.p1  ORF type:complete len:369 (+),score=159.04 c16998_g1_i1:52-1158(+)